LDGNQQYFPTKLLRHVAKIAPILLNVWFMSVLQGGMPGFCLVRSLLSLLIEAA